MNKIIFELIDIKESPNSKSRVSVDIRYEPFRQNGPAKELSEKFLEAIDLYIAEQKGISKITNVNKY